MQKCECHTSVNGQTVYLDNVYIYEPGEFNRRQKRLEKQLEWEKRRQRATEIIVSVAALVFFIICAIVYIQTGGIR